MDTMPDEEFTGISFQSVGPVANCGRCVAEHCPSWREKHPLSSTDRLPPGRWTLPGVLSLLIALASVAFIIAGAFSHRLVPLLLGATSLLGPSFAAVSVGWALDYKLARTPQSWRIRAMQWFFMSVSIALFTLAIMHRSE